MRNGLYHLKPVGDMLGDMLKLVGDSFKPLGDMLRDMLKPVRDTLLPINNHPIVPNALEKANEGNGSMKKTITAHSIPSLNPPSLLSPKREE